MLEAVGLTDKGSVRKNNEDYYVLAPDVGLYLVADGMGGARAGEHASRLAGEAVTAFFRNTERRDAEALHDAFAAANRAVKESAASDPSFQGMGTTLVAVLDCGADLLIASVGDSRAYAFHGGNLTLITEDQTWVEEVGRSLGIGEAELRTHPMRHVLTMAIGAGVPLKVRQYSQKTEPGAQLLLSSDGLHGVLNAETISKVLNSQQTLDAKCHYLIDAAIRAGGPDNITAVLLRAT